MLTIKEIKKGCEFADGFEFVNGCVNKDIGFDFLEYKGMHNCTMLGLEDSLVYKYFLQRVIEGINKKQYETSMVIAETYRADGLWQGHVLNFDGERYDSEPFDSIDQAKESAIRYILEQL